MKQNEKTKHSILTWLESLVKDEKKLRILVFCGLALIAILFLTSLLPDNKKQTTAPETAVSMDDDAAALEARVLHIVQSIEGVGRVQVMVTLESGSQTVYQSDVKRQTGEAKEDLQEEVVLVDGQSGSRQALVQTEKPPAVQGIVVVCDGADDIQVQSRVTEALTTAFGISSARVAVVKRGAE